MEEDKVYAIALSLVPGVGPVQYKRLLNAFGSARRIFGESPSRLAEVSGVGPKLAKRITEFKEFSSAQKEFSQCAKQEVTIISLEEESYPVNLTHIADPPPFLYVKGELKESDSKAVAMVGTRRCSNYGRLSAEKISRDLAGLGITVVSGMARGIDSIAHRGALAAGGRTLAVLGCGIDVLYPRENRDLYEQIPRQGALISEFPFGTPPKGHNFPRRNRIISGLSLGVVIVEAPARSGALITASLALDQGREVFAVPGSPGLRTSQGGNRLIKMGAKLTEGVEDVLEELVSQMGLPGRQPFKESRPHDKPGQENLLSAIPAVKPTALGPEEEKILQLLSPDPTHVDVIAERTGLPLGRVLSLLTQLELGSRVKQLPGMMFVKGL